MFSKLIFTIHGYKIKLELHEIVKIVHDMLQPQPGEKIIIESPETFNVVFDNMIQIGRFAHIAGTKALDPLLIVPYHISGMKTLQQWLFVAKYFSNNYKNEYFKGWWLLISGRLLLVKNEKDYRYFISDHGLLSDIISSVEEIAFSLPWTDSTFAKGVVDLKNKFDELVKNSDEYEYKDKYFKSIIEESLKVLKAFHPDKTDEELLAMQGQIKTDDQHKKFEWAEAQEMILYIVEKLLKNFCQLKFRDAPNFDHALYYKYNEQPEIADKIIRRIVLAQLAKEVNQGKQKPLFRPARSYGVAKKGACYHEFVTPINEHFLLQNASDPVVLARKARDILRGDTIQENNLSFLPNLMAAWFLAESARNPVSVLTSIMIIDMIENSIKLLDKYGNNLYSWEYTLVHPKNSEQQDAIDKGKLEEKKYIEQCDVKDLYENKTTPFDFAGSHPMTHSCSAEQGGSKFINKTNLNIVMQKEGGLILHWLYEQLNNIDPNFAVQLVKINEEPLIDKPTFDKVEVELYDIEKKIKKERGSVRESKKEDLKIDINKHKKKVEESLKTRIKQQLIKFLIKPLLMARLDFLENLHPNVDASQITINIFKQYYKIFQLNNEEYDFDEELIALSGNCLFEVVCMGANRAHRKKIPEEINTVPKLREQISKELLSNQTKYRRQVSQSIRDILYRALENNGELDGVSEPMKNILSPMLGVLQSHVNGERIFLDLINRTQQELHKTLEDGQEKTLREKLEKLRKDQKGWDGLWNDYFNRKVSHVVYRAYCENLLYNAACGGQLELEILAKLLRARIEIYNDNLVNQNRGFIIKKISGEPCRVGHSYTVNEGLTSTVHILYTGNNHYNLLNPTEYGLRHYLHNKFIRLPALSQLQKEYTLLRQNNILPMFDLQAKNLSAMVVYKPESLENKKEQKNQGGSVRNDKT